jgi:hypothetical protein
LIHVRQIKKQPIPLFVEQSNFEQFTPTHKNYCLSKLSVVSRENRVFSYEKTQACHQKLKTVYDEEIWLLYCSPIFLEEEVLPYILAYKSIRYKSKCQLRVKFLSKIGNPHISRSKKSPVKSTVEKLYFNCFFFLAALPYHLTQQIPQLKRFYPVFWSVHC